ncbi:hypothetical protein JCM17844_07070 [Iodidimonas gelatinilytica]|uniref:Gene transfer agent family protein n=1 Tax=Iodidimonas gelatinilytica TaxID=1236966 RepID=A0A5A7MM84_9PROT|nr:GTA-gp10 family protein [Iodidimonas gelatinilytica]GEQ97070.1 hypothetical protein JCM17844_07070 [Iodidimonas gelatinilytica]
MSGPVKERGDVVFALDGEAFFLRPTFAALSRIEQNHAPILSLVQKAGDGHVQVQDMAVVFHHCHKAGAGEATPSIEAIGDRIVATGLLEPLRAYRALLAGILGQPDASD